MAMWLHPAASSLPCEPLALITTDVPAQLAEVAVASRYLGGDPLPCSDFSAITRGSERQILLMGTVRYFSVSKHLPSPLHHEN